MEWQGMFLFIHFASQLMLFQGETHIMDVIKFSALQTYLDEAAEVDLKAARATYAYSFNIIDDYDNVPIFSSIYDE